MSRDVRSAASIRFFGLVAFAIFFAFGSAVSGEESEGIMNRMFAPGPLITGHKSLEGNDCLKCHDAGKGINQALCMSCHKDIAKFVEEKRGFHGLAKQTCIECHSEHKGRDYDSTRVDIKAFDHAKTGYVLEGKHAQIDCIKCHESKRKDKAIRKNEPRFLGNQTSCVSCHKKDDIHAFNGKWAKQDCNACHGLKGWKTDVKFNHTKDAGYELKGKHFELKCLDCHGGPKTKKAPIYKWKNLKTASCLACHADQHGKNFSKKFQGPRCTECHTETNWKVEKFDHKITGYPLRGKHFEIKCLDCHKQTPAIQKKGLGHFKFTGLKQDCLSCHADQHKKNLSPKFQNGKCLTCHGETDWKIPNFNHKVTGYALRGKHAEIKCLECHKQVPAVEKKSAGNFKFVGLKSACLSCHEDEHRFGGFKSAKYQRPNNCTECHSESSWKRDVRFDHSTSTRFKLTGAHESTSCEECHLQKMPFVENHDKSTPKKKGAALKPLVAGRMPASVPGKLSVGVYHWNDLAQKDCQTCHVSPHIGQFSAKLLQKRCTECHSTQSWYGQKDGKAFDHSKTRFPLDGGHVKVKCLDCHMKDGRKVYKFQTFDKKFCAECHVTPHKGQFSPALTNPNDGGACFACHKTSNWDERLPFDHSRTRYPLNGAHGTLNCNECHVPMKERFETKSAHIKNKFVFANLESDKCLTCHSDVHKGQLKKNCLECHNENKWKPVKFDHSKQSEYKLQFKHSELKCAECHKTVPGQFVTENKISVPVVRYKPIASECLTCHKDVHKGEFGEKCASCHTERGWNVTRDFHKKFTLNGVHFNLECAECHRDGRRLAGKSQTCTECHQKDDVHGGMLPNCGECHRQQFWENTRFHHSQTRFPLRGVHRTLECAECHRGNVMQGLSSDCLSCHRAESTHHGTPLPAQFMDCRQCHHTFSFVR